MSPSPSWYRSRSGYIFVVIVLLTIVFGVVSYQVIQWRRTIAYKTAATSFNLQILLVTVVDEETGVRGFVATGNPVFLQPYQAGRRQFASILAEVRKDAKVARLSHLDPDLNAIAGLHERWEHDVADPIVAGHVRAPALHLEVLGKELVDRMRDDIDHAIGLSMQALERFIFVTQLTIICAFTGIVALTSLLGAVALASERRRTEREREFGRRLAASNEELRRQRTSVLALNQLKNDLIAVLAHDIKGPLTSIGGFAELLEEGSLSGTSASDAARIIRANAQQLTTLTNDVLTLSRIEYGELDISDERIDVLDLVRTVVHEYLGERPINITSAVEHAFVRGDADRLRQVIDNLLRNALKYSAADKPVDVMIDANDRQVSLDVRDYGIGIPPEELPRLFRRFARASNARRAKIAGTGIGLFIVKMIVERHGGTISVESTPGEGSVFTVTLPSLDTVASWRPMRVVVVTDDTDLSGFVAYELRSRGYRVYECRTLDDLKQDGDLRAGDVILADADTATAQAIRTAVPAQGVRIIGLTGETDARGGWDVTLLQPFLVSDLIAAVKGNNGAVRDASVQP